MAEPITYENKVVRRALIISCDEYVSLGSTHGALNQNARAIFELFEDKRLDVQSVSEYRNNISNPEEFSNAIWSSFSSSDYNDLNIVYISCHGYYNEDNPNDSGILLSNGQIESKLDAKKLKASFEGIDGKILIIIDACNSGALIDRGMEKNYLKNPYYNKQFKFLVSSGRDEYSWFWERNENNKSVKLIGAGYFSSALVRGLDYRQAYPADINRDNKISLDELYRYMYRNSPSSVTYCYPMDDDYTLFEIKESYNLSKPPNISNIKFYKLHISNEDSKINFSFKINKKVVPIYQIVYYKNGSWLFKEAKFINDPACTTKSGTLCPLEIGNYNRTISLNNYGVRDYDYAIINIIEKDEDKLIFLAGRVINILSDKDNYSAKIINNKSFKPIYGEELIISLEHDYPCSIDLSVYDSNDKLIKQIVENQNSRPHGNKQNTERYIWSGKDDNGKIMQKGKYYIKAELDFGNKTINIKSELFDILE